MADRFIVWLSTSPAATWVIRHVASRLDPGIFKATNGRFTTMGPPAMPMLTMTASGRRSGQPRSVHLACVEHEGDYLVVASAMGQQRHPAWRYNIEANPQVQVQMRGERFAAGIGFAGLQAVHVEFEFVEHGEEDRSGISGHG